MSNNHQDTGKLVPALRPYQSDAIEGLRAAFRAGHMSPLLVSPTGSGKTVMFSYLSGKLRESKKRLQILVHRAELVDQVSRTLGAFRVPHGLITADATHDPLATVHVSSVFTLSRRMQRVRVPDYVICDEAHHCIKKSTWGKVIDEWREKNPALRLIGVTATPARLSGEGLGEMFDHMVFGPTAGELMEIGALARYRLFAPAVAIDLSAVKTVAGDFSRAGMSAALDKPAITGDAVSHYLRICPGVPAVAFCASIEHANHVRDQFERAGIRAITLDGKMDAGLRRQAIRDFEAGVIQVITSCDLISEGFDVPGIVCAILLRPTQSLALYLQQVGRALRPGKPNAIILDHVGNTARHGLPDDPREWTLTGTTNGRKSKAAEDSARQCGECFAVSAAAAPKCRECGKPFPVKSRSVDEVAGELSEIEVAAIKREAAKAQGSARDLQSLTELGRVRGMANPEGWAKHVLAAREKKQAAGR
jgi:superfamily II DNA or RNA helicase